MAQTSFHGAGPSLGPGPTAHEQAQRNVGSKTGSQGSEWGGGLQYSYMGKVKYQVGRDRWRHPPPVVYITLSLGRNIDWR